MRYHAYGNNRKPRRGGFTLTELMVAATLLVALMGLVAPLALQSGRLLQDVRRRQLALDELSNQLEYLTALEPKQRQEAIDKLEPSQELKAVLPSASITGSSIRDQNGVRLVLSMDWLRQGDHRSPSVTLVGWIDPLSESRDTSEESL